MKTKNTLLLFAFFLTINLFSQEKAKKEPSYKNMMYDININFYTVCDSAEAYFKTIDKDKKGSGYKPFLRWKHENEPMYYPSGNRIVDEAMPYNEYLRIKRESQSSNQQRSTQSAIGWQSLGPDEITNITGHYAAGLGRLEFVEVNTTNDQEIYLGSRSGGLWRTSNGGTTWSHNTDFLPASGVNAIAAKPTNFNEVLINVQSARTYYSHGIYKSIDGGLTFTPTNFIPAAIGFGGLGSDFQILKIQYHPTIPNLVFVGTNKGLYRSTDNLQTWSLLLSGGKVYDIDFHPTNPNIIYIYEDNFLANKNRILKSTDIGLTYTAMAALAGNGNKGLKISTSQTCPDCVFVSSDNGIWKSTDIGVTYTTIQNPAPTGVGLWGAMPNDLDITKFVSGYVDLFRSTDSGATFNQCTWWALGTDNGSGTFQENFNTSTHYVHADTNYLECINGVFYACTDGFLSKSSDNGVTWQKLSLTIGIRENYCLGLSQSNKSVSITGSQDNGTSIKNESGWIEAYGADGMEGIIMPLNPDYKIGSFQNGGRRRFLDAGCTSSSSATPPGQTSADWQAPLAFDPNSHLTVYSFGTKIHKSTDFGTTWVDLGTPTTLGGVIQTAAIAENNSNILVVTRGSAIEISNDGGLTFSNIKNGLPNSVIMDVKFDPKNDATIIISYASYENNGQKIYITHNSGVTWQNITYNLGNMPILSLAIDETESSTIYAGAVIGIYKKAMNETTWTLYNTNLPNVAIMDLEINNGSNVIKAATWGRGLWEEKLVGRENYPSIVKTEITNPPTFLLPKATIPQFVTSQIEYSGALTNVFVSWAIGTPTFNSTNVIPMTLISGTTWKSTTPLPDFPQGTKVYFKVSATGSSNDTSETYKFMYEVKPFEYCAASGLNNPTNLYLTNVTCSNKNTNYTGPSGYQFDNVNPLYIFKDATPINFSANASIGYPECDFNVWIDYNKNADFEVNEKVISDNNTGVQGLGSFVIPNDAIEGETRMRVRLSNFSNNDLSCGTYFGDVKDYIVNISRFDFSYSGNSTICQGANNTITYTGSIEATNINWQLQSLTNTYNFSGNSFSTITLPAGLYTIRLSADKNGITKSVVYNDALVITSTPSNVVISTPDETICANTVKTITATGGNFVGLINKNASGTINQAIPDNNLTTGILQTYNVTNLPVGATISKVDVRLNVNHTSLRDLRINLEAPNGKIINLFNQHGDSGDNLVNTIITSNDAATAFTNVATAAPFTGIFKATRANQTSIATTPAVNTTTFSELFSQSNGEWKLRIYDDSGSGNFGSYLNSTLYITYNGQQLTWEPLTNLYTSINCTPGTEYAGQNVTTVYTKPSSTITYIAKAYPDGCLVSDNVTFTINSIANKYISGNWTNGTPPTTQGVDKLEFDDPAGYNATTDLSGCSCEVKQGNVVISSGHNMIIDGMVDVQGGSLTIENNANLIQIKEDQNSGNIIVKRDSNPLMRLDYTIWSSPVTGTQTLKQFSPFTLNNRFYNYNTTTNLYNAVSNPVTQPFEKGKGYLIRMPDNHPTTPTIWNGVFQSGIPNNGVTDVNLTYVGVGQGFNMVGNPYPSAIDANTFLTHNATNINGTLYFWRKTNNAAGTAYATYTLGGATTTSPTSPIPNGIIQVGQGFLVEAKNGAIPKVTFTNSMRVGNNANQFFRNVADFEKHRYWLNLTNTDGLFSQMMVGYMTDATNGIDDGYDGKNINDSPISLTSTISNEEYTIQAKGLPFVIEDIVPLNFKTNVVGNFTISINNTDGFFAEGQEIFIKDNLLNSIHSLNEADYSFYSEAGNFNSRFEIVYQNSTLDTSNLSFDNIIIYPNPIGNNQDLFVKGLKNETTTISIFDVTGKEILNQKIENETIKVSHLSSGIYLVKIETDAKNVTKKLIVK